MLPPSVCLQCSMPNLLVRGDDSRRIGFRGYFGRLLLTLFLFYVNIYITSFICFASRSVQVLDWNFTTQRSELVWTFPYFYIDLLVIFPSSHITMKNIKSLWDCRLESVAALTTPAVTSTERLITKFITRYTVDNGSCFWDYVRRQRRRPGGIRPNCSPTAAMTN